MQKFWDIFECFRINLLVAIIVKFTKMKIVKKTNVKR